MKINWIKSLVVNGIILAVVLLLTDLAYESNDDFGIALRILEGYDNVLLINMFLCKALIPIQAALPGINVFVWMQIVMSFISFTVILKLLMDQGKSVLFTVVCILVLVVFSFDHYAVIQFTKTSALLVIAGALTVTDTIVSKRNPLYALLGLVLIYTGACLRFINIYVAVAFAGIYLICWLFERRGTLSEDGYYTAGRISLAVIMILLVGGTYAMNYYSNHNDSIGEYSRYNSYRADVIDYPVYQNYDQLKDQLDAIGISKNDLYMIDSWYLDYDGAASTKNLQMIDKIYQKTIVKKPDVEATANDFMQATIKNIRKANQGGIHIALLILLAAGGILCLRPRFWPYIILVGALSVALYLYLYYMGRTVYRASYVIDIGAAVWLLYYYIQDRQWKRRGGEESGFAVWERRVLCVIAIFLLLIPLVPLHSYCNEKAANLSAGCMDQELTSYLDGNTDRFFVFSTREKDLSTWYLTPAKIPAPGFEKNVLCFGGWGTKSEYTLDRLKNYGLSNMFGDIIDNDDVYVVEQKNIDELTEYFDKWYKRKAPGGVQFVQVDEVAGMKIWQVKSVTP